MKTQLLLAAALLVTATGTAQAQILDGWSGEASLAGSKTTGNTDTTDLGALATKSTVTLMTAHMYMAMLIISVMTLAPLNKAISSVLVLATKLFCLSP